MSRSLDIGATGMLAQQLNVDVISNNIANMTTTGYKRRQAAFQDLLYQNIDRPGASSSDANTLVPAGLQLGLGVKTGAVIPQHSQGPLEVTENPLDLAISGAGFFQIQLPSGQVAYTRDGAFQMNEVGEIVNTQGYVLQPAITIPPNAIQIEINRSGEVLVTLPNQPQLANLGQIQTANFINPAGLDAVGQNLLIETQSSGPPLIGIPDLEQFGAIQQGILEQSNVNVVEEITRLISAQRAYELNSNVITTSDEMLQTVAQIS